MEAILKDGDYIADGRGGIRRAVGDEAVLARILLKLSARRGKFSLWPEFGSRLYTLPGIRPGERENAARQFIAEALGGEEVTLLGVDMAEGAEGRISITARFEMRGESLGEASLLV